jgi:hypothetical protein
MFMLIDGHIPCKLYRFFNLIDCGLPAALCHWCGTWKGDKICGSCKKSRYCSEKHQVFLFHFTHPIGLLGMFDLRLCS